MNHEVPKNTEPAEDKKSENYEQTTNTEKMTV
jgi:hypothetical protein